MARDRDVRDAIQSALAATNAFDEGAVWIWGLPEDYGSGASKLAAAAIEPESSTQDDRFDGGPSTGLVVTSRITITFLYRHDDPQIRDEACENLVEYAAVALNGQSLASLTMPDTTKFAGWRWLPATAPERRIVSSFVYQYIVDGWASYDETD